MLSHLEVEMMMAAAAGVEFRPANGTTMPAFQVLLDGKFAAAYAAEDGESIPFTMRPNGRLVTGKGGVAIVTGVELTAALHPDGDDIAGRMPMRAPSLRIHFQPLHGRP